MNDRRRQSRGADQDAPPATADRLVETAASLFRARGYARSSTRQLGDMLGIRGASLYHHIKSKEDILYEICVRSLTTITADVQAAKDEESEPDERLRAMVRAHLAAALSDRDLHATMLTELRELSPERREDIVRRRAEYEAVIRTELVEDQRQGALRADMDVKYMTLGLLNLLNWTIFWYEPDSGLSPVELADVLFELYFKGTRAAT
jgi:AcrR family transcriptional regulator